MYFCKISNDISMKKVLLMFLVLGLGCMSVVARTSSQMPTNQHVRFDADDDGNDDEDEAKPYTHHEVTVGYGFLPSTSISSALVNSSYERGKDFIGSIFATYTYRFNHVVGLGATLAFDPANKTFSDPKMPDLGNICKVNQNNFVALLHLKINWLNTRVVAMYSKVGFGASFGKTSVVNNYPEIYEVTPSDKVANPRFAYTIVPVGIELGNRQYAAVMQLGFGSEGFFSIGFRYGFGFNKTDK